MGQGQSTPAGLPSQTPRRSGVEGAGQHDSTGLRLTPSVASHVLETARSNSSGGTLASLSAPGSDSTTFRAPSSVLPRISESSGGASTSTGMLAGGASAVAPSSTSQTAAPITAPAPAVIPASVNPGGTNAPAHRNASGHKTTTLIPGWSRQLSSQSLVIECQRIQQPLRAATPRETFGVLEMEVMKFVAYCGGVTVKFRVDELSHGPWDNVTWGLASTRSCPALHATFPAGIPAVSLAANQAAGSSSSSSNASVLAVAGAATSDPTGVVRAGAATSAVAAASGADVARAAVDGATPASGSGAGSTAGGSGLGAPPGFPPPPTTDAGSKTAASNPSAASSVTLNPNSIKPVPVGPGAAGLPVDSLSRKPLYMICSMSTQRPVSPGDILSVELAPREDKQPVIMATLRLNDTVLFQSSLPCSTISSLQMYPFISVLSGMSVSLHEAVTPSPLFTWYLAPNAPTAPEATFCELDTCVKYHCAGLVGVAPPAHPIELLGSTSFSSGRHRWTVQLDNYNNAPTYIFVGVGTVGAGEGVPCGVAGNGMLSNGPLRSIAGQATMLTGGGTAGGTSRGAAPSATAHQAAGPSSGAGQPGGSGAAQQMCDVVTAQAVGSEGPVAASVAHYLHRAQQSRWGSWIRLPAMGTSQVANTSAVPQPPAVLRDGDLQYVHTTESSTSHCFVTVDLDLTAGYVRFFRNGHLIGPAFTNLFGPVSPALAFLPGALGQLHCQGGLVNLTKLRQIDLRWNSDKCSGDLRLTGMSVTKVSEVFGDYSTVLANQGFISGVHLWLVKVNNLSEPDSIFIGVCRGCMPLDQDPQDLRDRTYYLSNGVIRVGGRRVATNQANFTKGDIVGVVLDADQGEIVFFRNGLEQGRARGIRGRLYPFVSCDSEADQITLLGSYDLLLNRTPRQMADMEWDTLHHASDVELSSNCLTVTKTGSSGPSTVRGTNLYSGSGVHEFHVILDALGPDGVWAGVAPLYMNPGAIVGDAGYGWALHSDGDKRCGGKEEEYAQAFKNGDVLTVCVDMSSGSLRFSRNGAPLGSAFVGLSGPLVAAVTLASEESKVTIQNRPTVLNTGEYTGELRWDEARAGKDLHVIDGLTVTKMANEGGDYATVLGTLCLASGQHTWNIYINHVEDSNLFIGVTVGGHDLNADPQEMKHRTYYLSNGTIRVAGKLVTRCAEPYAEGDLVSVQLDMEARHVSFLKNGVLQGAGDGLPEELWPYVSLDNILDSITLHSSNMFVDLAHSLRWNHTKCAKTIGLGPDGQSAQLVRMPNGNALPPDSDITTQASVLGLREYNKTEVHSWIVRLDQVFEQSAANFLLGVAPPTMELNRSLGEENCGIGLDLYGYFYVNGRYFHVSNLSTWAAVAKPVRGSTAKHKGKATPIFTFVDGRCEVTLTLDLREGTLKFWHAGRSIGTIAGVKGPLHAAVTLTSPRQMATLAPGPMGRSEHTTEELVHVLKAKGLSMSARLEAAMLIIPRDLFVPKDRLREAFRDQKLTVRMVDGSTMTLPPPSHVAIALERLGLSAGMSFLDVGCGTGYVTALAACLLGGHSGSVIHGIECVSSRLEISRANMKLLKERLAGPAAVPPACCAMLGDPVRSLAAVDLQLSNVLIPECTDGQTYDAIYCDAALSEEDLPTFLSLLRPGGRMAVIIEEDALLVSRTAGQDPHDFHREVTTQVAGEFGELEDPTPWEVQESIQRIKEREKRKGHEQARAEVASLRNFEYAEMQQRVTGAMQRIAELENLLMQQQRCTEQHLGSGGTPGGGGLRGSPQPQRGGGMSHPYMFGGAHSPLGSPIRGVGGLVTLADDVRGSVRDKGTNHPRQQHHHNTPGGGVVGTPGGGTGKGQNRGIAARGGGGNSPGAPQAGGLTPQRLANPTGSPFPRASVSRALLQELDQECGGNLPLAGLAPMAGSGDLGDAVGGSAYGLHDVGVSQGALDEIMDAMSVQMFSPEQVSAMTAGTEPQMLEGHEVYAGSFKGMRVRVWKMPISESVSYLELRRAYSKYCVAHPNIAAVLGVCIQCCAPPDYGNACSISSGAPPAPPLLTTSSSSRRRAPSASLHDDVSQDTSVGCIVDDEDDRLMAAPPLRTSGDGDGDESPTGSSDQHPPGGGGHHAGQLGGLGGSNWLWVVEERFGDESLNTRLERGLLSWQQVLAVATDICKALTFLQDLKRCGPTPQPQGSWPFVPTASPASSIPGTPTRVPPYNSFALDNTNNAPTAADSTSSSFCVGGGALAAGVEGPVVLSAYALRTIVTPSNVGVEVSGTKVSVLPALLAHLESIMPFDMSSYHAAPTSLGGLSGGGILAGMGANCTTSSPLHCDMAYLDPNVCLSDVGLPSFYAFGVVMLQLLTEHGPLGLLSAVREALENGTLMNLIPRLPATPEMQSWAESYARLALRCTRSTDGAASLESDVLPALAELSTRLAGLGAHAMSWEQVEEMLMLPLQPRASGADANRRWVRQDFRMRRKMFLEEVAKLAVDGPIHKIEIRRARCFKDAVAVFAGKGHAVWRQPLKVTFVGEAGMDSGGVTREWFSSLSSAISRGSPDLFWAAGPQKNQLYINPLSATPSHLRKFQFVGLFMAKAIVESAARGKELGAITLNLSFCEPFWKLLLGIPLHLMDLQLLDPVQFRSLMTLLNMDIDGLIFETFSWNFHHPSLSGASDLDVTPVAGAAAKVVNPFAPSLNFGPTSSAPVVAPGATAPGMLGGLLAGALPLQGRNNAGGGAGASPVAAGGAGGHSNSPFASGEKAEEGQTSIPLKPGGTHLKVTNNNKREYVLLKAHKMLVGAIESQTTAIIDAFHSLIPRELVDKYNFTSLEMQLLVCGEQRIDIADLKRHCKYEDGYSGREEVLTWFWEVVEGFDDVHRRHLLQFWSGSDGMPAEGFGALDPAFHIVAVERMYDAHDTTARLPAAHTCFRQLDLPRYRSREEVQDKLVTAVTMGQGYMALS